MSTIENEEQTETTEEETPLLLDAVDDFDSLFEEETEIEDPVIPEDLSEDELRRRLVAAEKKATFEREQRIKTATKNWALEAKEHFPYSSPERIKADSRRSFLEEAKRQDADFRERAQPIIEKASKTEEDIRAEIRAELEEEAAKQWGRPATQSGGGSGTKNEETEKRLEKSRKKRDLHGAVSALMDGGRF